MLVCVGDFLGPDDSAESVLAPYRSGDKVVPLRTYVLAGCIDPLNPLLAEVGPGGELAPDIVYLGISGTADLAGLRVAFISGGSDGSEVPPDAVSSLRACSIEAGFDGVDLLLSCAWPKGFFRQMDETSLPADLLPDRDLPEVGLDSLADLAVALRPRYHFCGGEGQFWHRPPYRLPNSTHVCRMVGLSRVQEDKKQVWLKAFGLVPAGAMRGAAPAPPGDTTDCPYPHAAALDTRSECNDFKLGRCQRGDKCKYKHMEGEPSAKRQKADLVKDSRGWVAQSCWFCVSSPQFESHLVTSIGSGIYLTLAKGPLVPNHALVIPISHTPCSLMLSTEEASEVQLYVDALRACFAARGRALLLFERFLGSTSSRAQFEHMHLQALPLEPEHASRVGNAFRAQGAKSGIEFESLPPGTPLKDHLEHGEAFFAAELPSGEKLLHRLARNPRRHPLQFGREVVASLIGAPERADWKLCMPRPIPGGGTQAELEEELASRFKDIFREFEPKLGQE